MNVGELKKALESVPDEVEVQVWDYESGNMGSNCVKTAIFLSNVEPAEWASFDPDDEYQPQFAIIEQSGSDLIDFKLPK